MADKVLIIDGSMENLNLMSDRLSYYDYNILTADTGVAGLTKARLFEPDLIIVDTELPDMSGFDLCKKIKDNEDTKVSLVLFISSLDTNDAQLRAFQVGADDIIEKGSDSVILISKVKSLLRIKHLVRQLGNKYTELQEKDKILNYQLKMGQQVQRSLIKNHDFTLNDIQYKSKYMPVLDIGGDFYDIRKISEDKVGLVIGDVSGHGISAALLTSMLNMMFTNLSSKYPEPDQLLFYMNNQFNNIFENSDSEMYAAVFCAIIDTKQKVINYSNAGHCLPLYTRDDMSFELQSYGTPIGLMKDSVYENKIIDYKKNDVILFYTDGLSDSFYKDSNEEFLNRAKEILTSTVNTDSIDEILKILLSTFYNYNPSSEERYSIDDVSMIICKML